MIFAINCRTYGQTETNKKNSSTADNLQPDTVHLKVSYKQNDIPVNEYLAERLKPIRQNFKDINSITNWTSIDTQNLWLTTEGGKAKFYYENENLTKIITRQYGETFQKLTEYYLLNGKLSFVFEKSYKYNRPIYYDSTEMKENNDKETFDFEKSEIQEDRSYFEEGKLIRKIESGDCGAPFASEYLLAEQKRIKDNFEKLIKLKTKN